MAIASVLLEHFERDIFTAIPVDQKFLKGWNVLSYFISLLGAFTTLIVLRGRTSPKGVRNISLLAGAAISMGGVAIFSMHYIGNRSVKLLGRSDHNQLHYSSGMTAASFFLPIVVVFLAFTIGGTEDKGRLRWVKVLIGGSLAGFSIAGMHYCGQAAITNFRVTFRVPYVIGSIIIAVVASNIALLIFFILRKHWEDSPIKIMFCAIILSAAVTSMHYTAALGTEYFEKPNGDLFGGSSSAPVTIFVLSISIGACVVLLGYMVFGIHRAASARTRARMVLLVSAIFDHEGNIMVRGSDGSLPAQQISETYLEFSVVDIFDTANPVFGWMVKASLNWQLIKPLIGRIKNHLSSTNSASTTKTSFGILFRELFCVAAQSLAIKLDVPLEQIGICYDKIVETGDTDQVPNRRNSQRFSDLELGRLSFPSFNSNSRLTGKTGQMIFLVKHIEAKETEHYRNRGFRFASCSNVASNIAETLNLNREATSAHLKSLQTYKPLEETWTPGWHVACFGVQAQLMSGFRIMVPSDNRQILPMSRIQDDVPSAEDLAFVQRHRGLTLKDLQDSCRELDSCREMLGQEVQERRTTFRTRLGRAISTLSDRIADDAVAGAILVPMMVAIPCNGVYSGNEAHLILFRFSQPLHQTGRLARGMEWSPLAIFNYFNNSHTISGQSLPRNFAGQLLRDFSSYLVAEVEEESQSEKTYKIGPNKRSDGIVVQHDVDITVQRMNFEQCGTPMKPNFTAEAHSNSESPEELSWVEQVLRFDGLGHWDGRRISASARAGFMT